MSKRVHILLPKIDGTWFTEQSIRVRRLLASAKVEADIRPVNQNSNAYPKLWLPRHNFKAERYTIEFMHRNRIQPGDVIYCHFGDLAKRIITGFPDMPCKFVVHCHGYDVGKVCYQDFHFYSKFQDKVHKFIVPTMYLGELLMCHGVPVSKIKCIQYGVDPDFWTPAAKPIPISPFRAVSVSRLVSKKRVIEAMHSFLAFSLAMREVDSTYRGIMNVVGGGDQFEQLKKTVEKLNDNSPGVGFRLLGDCIPEAVREELHRAHVFVACNARAEDGNTDGSPIAWLEALSCGVPVVAPEPLCPEGPYYKTNGTVVTTSKAIHSVYKRVAEGSSYDYERKYIMSDANWTRHCSQIINSLPLE